jgi:hypothetical protein
MTPGNGWGQGGEIDKKGEDTRPKKKELRFA